MLSEDSIKMKSKSYYKVTMSFVVMVLMLFLNGCGFIDSLDLIKEISFDSNFGTPVESIKGFAGKKIEEPSSPTKEHYIFSGWYIDQEFTEKFVFDKLPSDHIILYAKWDGTIHETPEGLRLLLKDDGFYGIESYVGTNPILIVPESYNGISITSVEILAFKGNHIIESITLPKTITLLRYGSFFSANYLTYFMIPSSVTHMEEEVFFNCVSLSEIEFETGSQLTVIGDRTFYGASALISITIPESVQVIGDFAFAECALLRYVIFDSNEVLTSIGECAFIETNLRFIFIPPSVTTIKFHAFDISKFSTIIYVKSETHPSGWDEHFFDGMAEVEWGSTRKLIYMTYAKPDGQILFVKPAASGTTIVFTYPDSSEGWFQGYYFDQELTLLFTLTTHPNESYTVYAKLVDLN